LEKELDCVATEIAMNDKPEETSPWFVLEKL